MHTGLFQSATAPLQTAAVTLKELSDQRWEFEFPPNIKGASWVAENKYLLRSKPLAQNKPYRFRCLWRRKLGQNGNNMHSVANHLFGTLVLPLQLRKWLASKPNKINHDLVQDSDTTVHGGWRPTWEGHWPWNIKSTIRKAELPRQSPCFSWCLTPEMEFGTRLGLRVAQRIPAGSISVSQAS